MKKHATCLSLLAAGLGLLSSSAHAALSVAPGDILFSAYQLNAAGTGVTGQTYVYNLGSGSGFREGTSPPAVIGNVNADLTTAFGAGWASDSSVRFGIVGVVGSTDPLTGGDPARTIYFSQAFAILPGDSTGITMSSGLRGTVATSLKSFTNSMDGAAENGAVDGGSLYASGNPNSFASFLPPVSTTHFGTSSSPLGSANGGTVGLDLYRMLHSTAGADLTAVNSQGDAVTGTGQYIGSFTLSNAGQIAFVPEPSTGILAGIGALFVLRRRRN